MVEITPKTYLTALIIFTLIIVGGINMIVSIRDHDPTFMNDEKFSDFNKSFNRYQDLNNSISGLQTSITGADPEWGVFGVLNALIKSAWASLSNLFSSLSFMNAAFTGLSVVFGVPGWIIGLITSLITVMIVFTIWALIFQGNT